MISEKCITLNSKSSDPSETVSPGQAFFYLSGQSLKYKDDLQVVRTLADSGVVDNTVRLKNTSYLSTSSFAVLTTIPELQFDISQGNHYILRVGLPYSSQSTGNGIAFSLVSSGSASASINGVISNTTSSTSTQSINYSSLGAVVVFSSSASTGNNYLFAEFNFIANSSGSLVPAFRSETSGQLIQILGRGYVILEIL